MFVIQSISFVKATINLLAIVHNAILDTSGQKELAYLQMPLITDVKFLMMKPAQSVLMDFIQDLRENANLPILFARHTTKKMGTAQAVMMVMA